MNTPVDAPSWSRRLVADGVGQRCKSWLGTIVVAALIPAFGFPIAAFSEPATATAIISLEPGVLVLKDGTRIEATRISRDSRWVTVHSADGTTRRFRTSEVDLDASEGVPEVRETVPAARRPQNRTAGSRKLVASEGSTRLRLPEPNQGQTWTRLERSGRAPGESAPAPEASAGAAVGGGVETHDSSEAEAKARAGIADLAEAWNRFDRAVEEVQQKCRGYTTGRSSCGSRVIAKSRTAHCHDALSRARALLPAIETQHEHLCAEARRGGVTPGRLRVLLAAGSVHNSPQRVNRARARLDADLE